MLSGGFGNGPKIERNKKSIQLNKISKMPTKIKAISV